MPELPEVETLRTELADKITGREITGVKVFWPPVIKPLTAQTLRRRLVGRQIEAVERRAKILIFRLSGLDTILIHLKMTGQLIYCPQGSTLPRRQAGLKPAKVEPLIIGGHPQAGDLDNLPNKFTRLAVELAGGGQLFFNDLRKFGWFKVVKTAALPEIFQPLGVEPLSADFTLERLWRILASYPKRPLKPLLLDQKLIAGLGNIYADESCFAARVLPTRRAGSLTAAEIKKLRRQIIRLLKLSLAQGGTSSRNYRRSDGSKGNFLAYLQVYGRAGAPCRRCRWPISKNKLAGRGTHFCPECQK